jgi:DNA helicase-2/ATP-dependent DNA helicase PcrA
MTAHASKGLEFPIVFIVGMGEGLFPLRCQTWTELEEERRLFYVALTRAEDISYVSFPETRTIYGSSKSYTESHLIRSIPQKLIKEI